jgi:4-aminobutyrate aminotransferase-like enzyme
VGALASGELLPEISVPPPGPRSRELARTLARCEAPGISTLGAHDEPTIVWEEALGANVRDVDGNVYVDLTAGFGVAAVGHRPPRVVAAVARQAGILLHGSATSPLTRRASRWPRAWWLSCRSTTRASTSPSRAPTRSRSR